MATYIPGKNDNSRPASRGELIALLGTVLCAGMALAIMVWRLIA